MSSAVLSLGSNLGDRQANLRTALEQLAPWLCACSGSYESPPWGPVEQGPFLNAVALVTDPAAPPIRWLERARDAEQRAGRTREVRWGPRTLDVDVIAVDDVHSDDPNLTLPHPRAHERAFVLVPWFALEPNASLGGVPIAHLLAALPAAQVSAVRLFDAAHPARR